jgi:hypothetical protein
MVYGVQCMEYEYGVWCMVYTVWGKSVVYTAYCILHTAYCMLHTVYCMCHLDDLGHKELSVHEGAQARIELLEATRVALGGEYNLGSLCGRGVKCVSVADDVWQMMCGAWGILYGA